MSLVLVPSTEEGFLMLELVLLRTIGVSGRLASLSKKGKKGKQVRQVRLDMSITMTSVAKAPFRDIPPMCDHDDIANVGLRP